MTAELLDVAADDGQEILISWLKPLCGGRVATERLSDEPLPFIVVEFVDGMESLEESYADNVYSVHTLIDKSVGWVAAKNIALDTHRRMLLLGRLLADVELPGGRMASIDHVKVFSVPRWVPYGDDQILRKVGRYQLGLPYTAVV